ncbi:MAG: DUF1552 domain-containing protein [Armatimonadaceae bacterium]
MSKREPISRRAVLRGTGAMLALPLLEAMLPSTARAAMQPPVRLGIFTVTGGTVLESWKPAMVGPLGALPSILRPLEPLKNELLVLSGLSQLGRSENLNAHEHCAFLHLTCADVVKKEGGQVSAGISIDQLIAQKVGGKTLLPSLEIGLGNAERKYSFRDAHTEVPYEASPRFVYERMFRNRKPVVPNWQARSGASVPADLQKSDSLEQSVLDLVGEQAKSLQRQLGVADRQKLGGYLESVRSVEKRLSALEHRLRLEAKDAANPGTSRLVEPNLDAELTPFHRWDNLIHRDPEKHAEYIRVMSDLLVLAFQTDSTRVAVFAAGSDEALFPGVVTVGYERHCHTLEHQGNAARVEDADPISREACRQMHAWYTALFAETARKMQAIDEGGSSLLDNTMLVYTSYMANGGHDRRDYPVMIAGRGGGTLKPGRHIAYQEDTPVANLYIELANRMGVRIDSFGNSRTAKNAAYNGRLPDLV